MDVTEDKKPRFQRYMSLLNELESYFETQKTHLENELKIVDRESDYNIIFNELDKEVIKNINNIIKCIKEKKRKLREKKESQKKGLDN